MFDSIINRVAKKLPEKRIVNGKIVPKILELLVFIRSLDSKKRIIKQYQLHMNNKAHNLSSRTLAHLIADVNYATNGKIEKEISQLRKKVLKNKSSNIEIHSSDIFDTISINKAISELNSQGFAVIGNISHLDFFGDICKLKEEPVYSGKQWKSNRNSPISFLDQPNLAEDFIWYVDQKSVIENIGIQKFLNDSFWKIIGRNYLNGACAIQSIRCWHSYPKNVKEFKTPENWHIDAGDGFNFIKLFLLLSDVNEKNGPTQIVPIQKNNLPRKFFVERRFSEREIAKLCKKTGNKVLSATGSEGTVYIADTRQIHRGTPVIEGHRFIVNFTLALDDFGSVGGEKYLVDKGKIQYNLKNSLPCAIY